jgi:hypothetical protein
MPRRRRFTPRLDALEGRLSLSIATPSDPTVPVPPPNPPEQPDPPPEPSPGTFPGQDPPIVLPPPPLGGPVGPA